MFDFNRRQLPPDTVMFSPETIGCDAIWPITALGERTLAGLGADHHQIAFELRGDDTLLEVELGDRVELAAVGRWNPPMIASDKQPDAPLPQFVDIGKSEPRAPRKRSRR